MFRCSIQMATPRMRSALLAAPLWVALTAFSGCGVPVNDDLQPGPDPMEPVDPADYDPADYDPGDYDPGDYDPGDYDPGDYDPGDYGAQLWTCGYSPTMNRDWHDDVLCTNGQQQDRPYLLPNDSFITQDEIMRAAARYEHMLNR